MTSTLVLVTIISVTSTTKKKLVSLSISLMQSILPTVYLITYTLGSKSLNYLVQNP